MRQSARVFCLPRKIYVNTEGCSPQRPAFSAEALSKVYESIFPWPRRPAAGAAPSLLGIDRGAEPEKPRLQGAT